MTHAFVREIKNPATILLLCGFLLFQLAKIQIVAADGQTNLWDAVIPAVTDSHFIVLFMFLWWCTVLLQTHRRLQTDLAFIRFGSLSKFVWSATKEAASRLGVAAVLNAIVAIAAAFSLGFSLRWSPDSKLATANQGLDIFSAAAAAQIFHSPVEALFFNVGFCALAFLGMSIVFFVTSASGQVRLANAGLLIAYLWVAACSFGVASTIPALDGVVLFDFTWSLSQGLAWQAITVWVVVATVAILILINDFKLSSLISFSTRFGGVILVFVLAFPLALSKPGTTLEERWQSLFAGQFDSLVGYCSIQLLLFLLASLSVARFIQETAPDRLHAQIRVGSRQKILSRLLLRVSIMLPLGSASIVVAAIAGFLMGSSNMAWQREYPMILQTTWGLWLTLVVVTFIGLAAVSFVPSMQTWFWSVAVFLVCGYPLFLPLGSSDIFALYSLGQKGQANVPWSGYVAAAVVVFLCFGLIFALNSRRALQVFKSARNWIG